MGRDLLAQDYILKQITASLIYPEEKIGKKFWDKVYKKSISIYGQREIPINTFNKVWIIPDKAIIYENKDTAFIIESHLKVMMESDYLALNKSIDTHKITEKELNADDVHQLSDVSTSIMRNIILPIIEEEVNNGENFALLRQIYQSLILAAWFNHNLKESLLGQVYVDQNKILGIDVKDKTIKDKIYQQYLEAFKKGVFHYIKEDYDPSSQIMIPRKYFSGGATLQAKKLITDGDDRKVGERGITVEDYSMLVEGTTVGQLHKASSFLLGTHDNLSEQKITPEGLVSYLAELKTQGEDIRLIFIMKAVMATILNRPDLLKKGQNIDPHKFVDALERLDEYSTTEAKCIITKSGLEEDYNPIIKELAAFIGDASAKTPSSAINPLEMQNRKEFLEGALRRYEQGDIPKIINFGDKHGVAYDLERILHAAYQSAEEGRQLKIIGHGDVWDRGHQNFRNFEILKELKRLAEENSNISVHFLLGNHDVWIPQSILLNDSQAQRNWLPQEGQKVVDEFQDHKVNIKELALFVLENFELMHIDELGFLHVHAGIPMDKDGNPLMTRNQIEALNNEFEGFKKNLKKNSSLLDEDQAKQKLAIFLERASPLFWTREEEWVSHLIESTPEDQIEIDEGNKTKVLKKIGALLKEKAIKEKKVLNKNQLDKKVQDNWAKFLIKYQVLFRELGIVFKIIDHPLEINTKKLNNFLDQLGIAGVFFGHIHRPKVWNIANKIICIDVEEGDPGHLNVTATEGFTFDGMMRSVNDNLVKSNVIISNLKKQIARFDAQLTKESTPTPATAPEEDRVPIKTSSPAQTISKEIQHKEIKIPKEKMEQSFQKVDIRWSDGTFGLVARTSTKPSGALIVSNIKIDKQKISGIYSKDLQASPYRVDESLFIDEGETLKIGRNTQLQKYVFVVNGKTFLVEKNNQHQYILVKSKNPIKEEHFLLSRVIENRPSSMSVKTQKGERSSTTVEFFSSLDNKKIALKTLKGLFHRLSVKYITPSSVRQNLGFSGNTVDYQIIQAQQSLNNGNPQAAVEAMGQVIRLLKEVDFEAIDKSNFPLADMINEMEIALKVLEELKTKGLTDKNMDIFYEKLKVGENGLALKQTLGYKEKVGGVNLNPNLLNFITEGNGIDFEVPATPINIENINIDGYIPIIFRIIPIINLPLFLLGSDHSSNDASNLSSVKNLEAHSNRISSR